MLQQRKLCVMNWKDVTVTHHGQRPIYKGTCRKVNGEGNKRQTALMPFM
jgi:hypothetical protein